MEKKGKKFSYIYSLEQIKLKKNFKQNWQVKKRNNYSIYQNDSKKIEFTS